MSSSDIDKMLKMSERILEQNANIYFEPFFENSVNFAPVFEKN